MPPILNRYATPALTGIFLITLISGFMLFFHVAPPAFHGMHEWLGLLLVLPFGLHLWKNWRPMRSYLRHAPMAVAAAASVALAALDGAGIALADAAQPVGPAASAAGKSVMDIAAALRPLLP